MGRLTSRVNDSPEKPGLFCKSLTKLVENDYQYHRVLFFSLDNIHN